MELKVNRHEPEVQACSKVPEVTAAFWFIKIIATTLGETGGDTLSMSLKFGYLVGTGIFAGVFVLAVVAQIRSRRFYPNFYWLTIVATTTLGTTLADFVDRSLHIGYAGGTSILAIFVLLSLSLWKFRLGSTSIAYITSSTAEMYYWTTILFSQTLGTALGDWVADTRKFGYLGAALLFGALLLLITVAYYRTSISRAVVFWAAFVLTRPLGAVLGDFLDKPLTQGGLDLSRIWASAALCVVMLLAITASRPKASRAFH
jgi:uncharacterized membrane-anchored protein